MSRGPTLKEGGQQQLISKISEEDEDLEQSFYSKKPNANRQVH